LKESLQLFLQRRAISPQPIIFVIIATATNASENKRSETVSRQILF
jgi:flagellar basal body L-ring protein FlgH